MRNRVPMGTFIAMAAPVVVFSIPMAAQHPTPVLRDQPGSPLEVVAMRPVPYPPRPNVPPRVLQEMAAYDLVVRNKTGVPIMAYAFRHELTLGDKIAATCQASMGFSQAMIGAGETKTIQSFLHGDGPTITPVVDLVLLQDGRYYGADTCRTLSEFTTRLSERRSLFDLVMRRIEKDGVDKTTAWMKQELSVDVSALRAPKKMQ